MIEWDTTRSPFLPEVNSVCTGETQLPQIFCGREVNFVNGDYLLIRKMKQGDDHAFDLFVRKYYEEILSYCHYHCPDQAYAEDLTQETFARFFAKLSDYRYQGKTKNYLYTIAGNLCRDYFKKIRESPLEETELSKELGSEAPPAEDVVNQLAIAQALGALQEELREVVILYYFQELKLKEIADALQIGLPLVKYRLKQAKNKLREFLA